MSINFDINNEIGEVNNTNIMRSNSSQNESKYNFLNRILIQNKNLALVILSACVFTQNAVINGANNAILTTIERTYYMTSLDSALFLCFYEISNIIAAPIIGYFGDRVSKPKTIGLSMIGLSLGSFIMLIPHFYILKMNKRPIESSSDIKDQTLCQITNHTISSLVNIPPKPQIPNLILKKMKYLFYTSNIINGVSSVALYTIVISYIENMFMKEKVYLRQGIYYASGAIGIGIGMFVTGNFLNINGIGIKQKSVQNFNWIGAWWIIYVISIFLNIILSILVFSFSSKLISFKNNDKEKNANIKDFFNNASKILSNRVFLFITITTTFETFLIKGYSSNLTKFLEYEYRLQASTSTMVSGAIGFVSLVFGPLTGAYLVKKFKWTIKECSKFVLLILSITSIIILGIILTCPQEQFTNFPSLRDYKPICTCESNSFYPICYKNLYIFQSPCHAGCTKFSKPNLFSNCFLIDNMLNQSISMTPCTRPASHCIPNLVTISFIGLIVLFLSSIVVLPILRILLESVDSENQSFALGIRSLVNKLFGNIPSPIVFALFIDKSCILWTLSPITYSRVCRLYNNRAFSLSLGLLGFTIRLLSAVSTLITFYYLKKHNTVLITDINTEIQRTEEHSKCSNNGRLNRTFENEAK